MKESKKETKKEREREREKEREREREREREEGGGGGDKQSTSKGEIIMLFSCFSVRAAFSLPVCSRLFHQHHGAALF